MFEKEVREAYKKTIDEWWTKVKGKEYTCVGIECESFSNWVFGT